MGEGEKGYDRMVLKPYSYVFFLSLVVALFLVSLLNSFAEKSLQPSEIKSAYMNISLFVESPVSTGSYFSILSSVKAALFNKIIWYNRLCF